MATGVLPGNKVDKKLIKNFPFEHLATITSNTTGTPWRTLKYYPVHVLDRVICHLGDITTITCYSPTLSIRTPVDHLVRQHQDSLKGLMKYNPEHVLGKVIWHVGHILTIT